MLEAEGGAAPCESVDLSLDQDREAEAYGVQTGSYCSHRNSGEVHSSLLLIVRLCGADRNVSTEKGRSAQADRTGAPATSTCQFQRMLGEGSRA